MELTHPAPDEIEVSLFGPGVGESVVVHGGGGRWLIIDSCREEPSAPPVALAYLDEIGAKPDDVRLVVATHWDDDHSGGLAEVHKACASAKFACSVAINRRDFSAFVLEREQVMIRQGSGVDEFRTILRDRTSSGVGSPEWVQWNVDLLGDTDPFELDVWGLSPSPEAVRRGLSMLAHRAHGLTPARRAVDVGPNECSVALWIRAGGARILLGGDLAEPGVSDRGWSAILGGDPKRWLENGPASLFKVAHHGSAGARHDGIWKELLGSDPVALLTPKRGGKNSPPTAEGRAWIRARTARAHTTVAAPVGRRRKRRSEVEKVLRASGKRLFVPVGFGHLRARTSSSAVDWVVDHYGSAGTLPP